MQMQHVAHVAVFKSLLVICVAQEGQHHAVCSEGRLYAVRNELFVGEGVHVFHGLAGMVLMGLQVVICTAPCSCRSAPGGG